MSSSSNKQTVPSPSRRKFLRRALLGTLLAGAGSATYAHEIEPRNLGVTELDVPVSGWPRAADGFRVGQISDLHCDCDRAVAAAAASAELLMSRQPDVVFLTGDYVTTQPLEWSHRAASALSPVIQAPGGAFAVTGNHDYGSRNVAEVMRQLHRAGIRPLRNEAAPIPGGHGAWVVGLDSRCERAQRPERALRGVPRNAAKILLIHEPDYADESPHRFSLQLSGHSHGGQVRIPGVAALHTPRYARIYIEGLNQGKSHPVFVTRGVGMVGPRFRLFCPPEVVILRLRAA